MDLYRQALAKIYDRDRDRVTDKHLRLVLFASTRPKDQTLAEGVKIWNRQNPELKYGYHTNFGPDIKEAGRKLRLENASNQRSSRAFGYIARAINDEKKEQQSPKAKGSIKKQ